MESGHRRRDEWTVSRDRWRVRHVGGTSGLCLGTDESGHRRRDEWTVSRDLAQWRKI